MALGKGPSESVVSPHCSLPRWVVSLNSITDTSCIAYWHGKHSWSFVILSILIEFQFSCALLMDFASMYLNLCHTLRLYLTYQCYWGFKTCSQAHYLWSRFSRHESCCRVWREVTILVSMNTGERTHGLQGQSLFLHDVVRRLSQVFRNDGPLRAPVDNIKRFSSLQNFFTITISPLW